ncbi:benzoate 4-monooxygenase cytochrome P450 [Pestalotiopsis sp. NC0098]|nr:benzoate 4-monooxygenase cytochrome P450 [Pestalotiopsis sp. NC0098]
MSAKNSTGWPGSLSGGAFDSALPVFAPLSYSQVIASFIAAAFVASFIYRIFFSPIRHVPGPFPAKFTRLWHIYTILAGKQNLKLVELHKKHGHFVRISHDEVSVSHPNAIKALYLNPIPKGNWYRVFVFPDWRFPLSMSIQDPKKKADFMKYLSNAGFSLTNILQREPDMDEQIKLLLGWIDKYAAGDEPMALDKFLTYIAFDIVGIVTFSAPFGFVRSGRDVGSAILSAARLQLYMCTVGFYPWLSYLLSNPLVTWTELMPVGLLATKSARALEARRANPDASFDMCSHWYKGLRKAERDGYAGFKERHVMAAAVSNVGAGTETVSCGLQSCIYHLLRQPIEWQRIRDEIDAARKQGRCQSEVVSYEDASRLPRLEAAIKEGLRMLPPVPMGLPRIVPEGGVTIGDATFTKGTTLSVNPSVMHLSKEIWGPDAEEFKPDRWFSPDIAKKERYFMPWSAGWASCPGQHLAKVQFFKIIATIVRNYDLSLVNPEKEWEWAAYFTVIPRNWPVHVNKREVPT